MTVSVEQEDPWREREEKYTKAVRILILQNSEIKELYDRLGYSYRNYEAAMLLDMLEIQLSYSFPSRFPRSSVSLLDKHNLSDLTPEEKETLWPVSDDSFRLSKQLHKLENLFLTDKLYLVDKNNEQEIWYGIPTWEDRLRSEKLKEEILDAIIEFRSAFRDRKVREVKILEEDKKSVEIDWAVELKEGIDIEALFQSLRNKIASVVVFHRDEIAREKKGLLDLFLRNLLEIEHEYKPSDGSFTDGMATRAKEYLNAPWMHTPWLTNRIVANLLNAHIVPLTLKQPSDWLILGSVIAAGGLGLLLSFHWVLIMSLWLGCMAFYYLRYSRRLRIVERLQLMRDGVASGHYDGQELARRLKEFEKKGLYVHTLIYTLLQLGKAPSPGPKVRSGQ